MSRKRICCSRITHLEMVLLTTASHPSTLLNNLTTPTKRSFAFILREKKKPYHIIQHVIGWLSFCVENPTTPIFVLHLLKLGSPLNKNLTNFVCSCYWLTADWTDWYSVYRKAKMDGVKRKESKTMRKRKEGETEMDREKLKGRMNGRELKGWRKK